MEQLPNEIALNILLDLPINSLLRACQTNSSYRDICRSEYFWRQKIAYDLDIYIDKFPESPLQFYMALQNEKVRQVPVYFDKIGKRRRRIGKVWVGDKITDGYILQSIERILEDKYPKVSIDMLASAPYTSTYQSLGERSFRERNSDNTYISNDIDDISGISVFYRR